MSKQADLWFPAPNKPTLSENEVHVWRIPVTALKSHIQQLLQILDQDEINRAQRFHFFRDHRRYVKARAGLRNLIGKFVECIQIK